MFIESVVVCDRYHDFLAETLPHNRLLFDKMVVVTSYEDKATQRLCEYWNVGCVPTDRLQPRKGQFCKGAGINNGLSRLSLKGWTVYMDADIMLPPLTRQLLDRANLDPSFIYGIDRHMVPSYGDWRKFLSTPGLQQEAKVFCHTRHFEIGVRVIPECFDDYVPIGFFQLCIRKPAACAPILFAIEWPRAKRSLIPEVICYHLESEKAPMGPNWNGRATKRFERRRRGKLRVRMAAFLGGQSGTLSLAAIAQALRQQSPLPPWQQIQHLRGSRSPAMQLRHLLQGDRPPFLYPGTCLEKRSPSAHPSAAHRGW